MKWTWDHTEELSYLTLELLPWFTQRLHRGLGNRNLIYSFEHLVAYRGLRYGSLLDDLRVLLFRANDRVKARALASAKLLALPYELFLAKVQYSRSKQPFLVNPPARQERVCCGRVEVLRVIKVKNFLTNVNLMRRPFGELVGQFRWERIIDIEGRCGGKAASVIIRRYGSGNGDIRVLIYRRHLGRLSPPVVCLIPDNAERVNP